MNRFGAPLWIATASLVAGATVFSAQTPAPAALHAFVGATVIDVTGKSAIKDATLIVRDGRVDSIGSSKDVPTGRGHPDHEARRQVRDPRPDFGARPRLRRAGHASRAPTPTRTRCASSACSRATASRRSGASAANRSRPSAPATAQNTPSLDRARLYVAGDVIVGKTPEEARQMVARVAAAKPDVIKIRVDDNLGTTAKMPPEVYRAVIDEAHRRGLRVAAHLFYLDDAKDLLRAGVDVIAHSVRDKDIDDEFISLMKARSVAYCPTLTRELSTFVYESTPAFFADPFFLREADRDVVAQLQEPARQAAMRGVQERAGLQGSAARSRSATSRKRADAGAPRS